MNIDKDGNEYQIGSVYEFSDDKKDWRLGTLNQIQRGVKYQFEINTGSVWLYIRESQEPLGTINPPPIKLIEGEWYMCKTRYGQVPARYTENNKPDFITIYKPLYRMAKVEE